MGGPPHLKLVHGGPGAGDDLEIDEEGFAGETSSDLVAKTYDGIDEIEIDNPDAINTQKGPALDETLVVPAIYDKDFDTSDESGTKNTAPLAASHNEKRSGSRRKGIDDEAEKLAAMKADNDFIETQKLTSGKKQSREQVAESRDPLKTKLVEYIGKLQQIDSVVALSSLLDDMDDENTDYTIGAFKLAHPSLKALNDIILGYDEADVFLGRLRDCMQQTFGDVMTVFHGKASQNHFLLNYDKCREVWAKDILARKQATSIDEKKAIHEIFSEKIKKLQVILDEILYEQIFSALQKEVEFYNKRTNAKSSLDDDDHQAKNDVTKKVDESKRKILNLSKAISCLKVKKKISIPEFLNKNGLGEFKAQISTMPEPFNGVKLGFGLVDKEHGEREKDKVKKYALMIALSVLASNMCDVRTSDGRKEIGEEVQEEDSVRSRSSNLRVLQIFAPKFLIHELFKARSEVEKHCVYNGSVESGYEDFFTLESGVCKLKPDIINQYRKERSTRRYTGALADTKKRKVLREYYNALNMMDFMKNYIVENFAAYRNRVDSVIATRKRMIDLVADPTSDVTTMTNELENAKQFMEISFKDRGAKIIHETRGAIEEIFDNKNDNNYAVGFVDHIGFGAKNLKEYEEIMLQLLDMFGLSNTDKLRKEVRGDREDRMIQEGLVEKFKNPELLNKFYDTILQAGDNGSEHLRETETALRDALLPYAQKLKLIPGGDECTIMIKRNENVSWEQIRTAIDKVAKQYHLRIALQGMRDESDTTPSPIVYLRAKERAAKAIETVKQYNSSSPFTVAA